MNLTHVLHYKVYIFTAVTDVFNYSPKYSYKWYDFLRETAIPD